MHVSVNFAVNVDIAGRKGLRIYVCVCVSVCVKIYLYNCKYITRSSKTFFFKSILCLTALVLLWLLLINISDSQRPLLWYYWGMKSHLKSSALPVRPPGIVKVSKAAMWTHHANIQGTRVGRRVQETTGKWLVKECKNIELLWIFYSFLIFKNKNKFWIYSTQPGREL